MNQEELELQSDEKGLDIRKVIMKALGLWPWMLLCMFICIAIASIYLYFAQPTYKVNASILIKDQSNNLGGAAGAAPEMNMLQSIGLLTGASSVDNELQIVKSYTLMYEVVKKMQLNVGYKIKSGLKDVPVYGEDLPFVVTAIRTNEDTLEVTGPMEYTVSPGKGGTINIEDANSNTWKGKWGDTLSLPAGKVMLHLLPGKSNKDIEANYIIRIVNMDMMTADLMDKLDAEIPNKQASVIDAMEMNGCIAAK